MSKTKYMPDRTLKNIRLAANSKRNMKPVLSCKACPEGVSPEKSYGFWRIFFYYLFSFHLCRVLRDPIRSFVNVIVSEEWNHVTAAFLSFVLAVFCCMVLSPIFVLLSFYFKNWIPAEKHEIESTKKKPF